LAPERLTYSPVADEKGDQPGTPPLLSAALQLLTDPTVSSQENAEHQEGGIIADLAPANSWSESQPPSLFLPPFQVTFRTSSQC
jgi:hypothetical protein